ncbi:MAG: hypothetical protein QGD94_08005, partial [Planctomycetia bacterium]|nr:hypothetical protein [Planctomycetia bacterium]
MRVGRMMFIFALLGVCVAGASCGFFLEIPSLFVSDAPTPLPPPPRELELTDLQREELSRVLSPAPLPAGPKSVGRISIDFADSADDGLYLSEGAEALLPVKLVLRFSAVGTQRPLAIKASYRAYDFYGRAIASGPLPPLVVPAGGVAETTLAFEKIREVGAFTVRVTAEAGGEEVSAVHRFGIIPAPAKVEAEECPFGVAGSSKRFAQYARLGARHVLAHFADGRNVVNFGEQTPDPDQWSPGFNFTPGMETLQRAEDAGVELLPIIGFGPASRKSETAKEASVKRFGTIQGTPYGPPADAAAFADWTAGTVEYFSDRLVRWQIWRDPAVGGWSWAGTPREYRNLLAAVAWELSDREVETGLAFAATAGMLAEAVEAQWEPPAQMACALSTYAESTATSLAAGEFRSELAGALASASR